jgi:hypothetical protein
MLCAVAANFRPHAVMRYSAVVMPSVWAVAFQVPSFESWCCTCVNSCSPPVMGAARPAKRSGPVARGRTANPPMVVPLGPMPMRARTGPQRRLGWDCYDRPLPPIAPSTALYTVLRKRPQQIASWRRVVSGAFCVDARGSRRSERVSSLEIWLSQGSRGGTFAP